MANFVRRIFHHLFKGDGDKHRTDKANTGFSVKAIVPTEKTWDAPVVSQCTPGAGGVQGLRWYTEKLKMDEDGDVAQEFMDEVTTEALCSDDPRKFPTLEVKLRTRPVKPKGPICTFDGNVHQSVETSRGVEWG